MVERAEQFFDFFETGCRCQRRTRVAADRVSLEIPTNVLADVAATATLVLKEFDEELGVTQERGRDRAKPGHRLGAFAHHAVRVTEGRGKIAEEPGAAEASTTNNHTIAACLGDHAKRVVG